MKLRSLVSTLPGFGQPGPVEDAGSVDARMVALMRCLLAVSAFVVITFFPAQPVRFASLAHISLTAYVVYAVLLALSTWRNQPFVPARARHWLDVLFYAWMMALTEGASSIFFPFFFFAILVSSFSFGLREGLLVTAASALLFLVLELLASAPPYGLEIDQALIRPMILFLLGYMIAYWGGHEIALRRRLHLLRKVSRFANPRLGVDHALVEGVRRLVEFFNAELGVLIRAQGNGAPSLLYRLQARSRQAQAGPETLNESAARALLGLPPEMVLTWSERRAPHDAALAAQCRAIAELLGTPHFMTAPYDEHESTQGRLYIAAKHPFSHAEADFLAHVAEQVGAAVDNLKLLDKLMVNAAQLERARIARDIHDTSVQPYIGLRLGLQALQRKIPPGSNFAANVQELIDMSGAAVEDLRGYVRRLQETRPRLRGEQFVHGVLDQIARYRSFYAIDVELRGEPHLSLSDKIASEAYQIVCEALSNIYRHTKSRSAYVELRREGDALRIEVGNGREPGATSTFTPRSIVERARALGGDVEVRLDAGGHDVVTVQIPL